MARSILALILFTTAITFFGQDQSKLDSLRGVYRDGKATMRDRLRALGGIAHDLRNTDPDSSLYYSQQLLDMAKAAPDTIMIAEGYRSIALAYFILNNSTRALQVLDSSLLFYSTKKDSLFLVGAANAHSNKGYILKQAAQLTEAIQENLISIELHRAAKHTKGLVFCFNDIGQIHLIQGRLDSALFYFQRVVDIATELDLPTQLGWGLNNMGTVYLEQGRMGEAIELAYRTTALMERIKDDEGLGYALIGLSDLRAQLGEEDRSLETMRRAFAIFDKANIRAGAARAGSGIANRLMTDGKLDSAIYYLENALRWEKEDSLYYLMGFTMTNLGSAYRMTGRMDDARRTLTEDLENVRAMDDASTEVWILNELATLERDLGQPNKAIAHNEASLAIAERIGTVSGIETAYNGLYLAYKMKGQAVKALSFLERSIALRDSIASEKAQRQLTQRDMLDTFDKQQLADSLVFAAEREKLENERIIESLRADQNRNRGLAFGFGGLLLIGGGGAWFYTDRKRRQERFEKEAATLETQALRSQMNPHFIFNALNSINAFVQRNDQDSATSYLSKFARVMRSVLENSRHAEVPLADDLETLRGYLDLERMRMEKKFDFTITVDPALDPEEVMVPPLVVQPFVENAIWHGMANKEGKGHISLTVSNHAGQMRWTIEDDGAGRHAKKAAAPNAAVKKTSLGTAITRARLDLVQKQHGGKAGFQYTDLPQGTRVEVDMPMLVG